MLLVKGANVMQGYLGQPELTAKVVRDGWYVTGDVAYVDEDGFLFITDRLSRFSKIGGEMVPHGRVEEVLHEAAGAETMILAVTGVPDEKRVNSWRSSTHWTLRGSRRFSKGPPPPVSRICFCPAKTHGSRLSSCPCLERASSICANSSDSRPKPCSGALRRDDHLHER